MHFCIVKDTAPIEFAIGISGIKGQHFAIEDGVGGQNVDEFQCSLRHFAFKVEQREQDIDVMLILGNFVPWHLFQTSA